MQRKTGTRPAPVHRTAAPSTVLPAAGAAGAQLAITAQAILSRIATLLLLLGHSPDELAATFARAAAAAARKRRTRARNTVGTLPWWVYGRVLTQWHQSPQFTDAHGQAVVLPLRGRGTTFNNLVRQAVPGANPRTILTGLLAVGAARRRGATAVRATTRSVVFKDRSQIMLGRALQVIDGLTATVHLNLVQSRSKRPGRGLFERSTHSETFDLKHVRALDQLVRVQGQALLEFLDNWMSKHETRSARATARRGHVGVGIYLFAEPRRQTHTLNSRTRR